MSLPEIYTECFRFNFNADFGENVFSLNCFRDEFILEMKINIENDDVINVTRFASVDAELTS